MGGRGGRGRERERKGKREGEQEEEGWGVQEQLSLLLGKEEERVASLVDAGGRWPACCMCKGDPSSEVL